MTKQVILSNAQISCTIGLAGIESISVGSKVVTTTPSAYFAPQGLWEAQAAACFPPVPGAASLGPPVGEPVLHNLTTHAMLAVTYANAEVDYHYSLIGSDIFLTVDITNNGDAPLQNFVINLPTFAFGLAVTGNMKSWNADYILPNAPFHPSWWVPLAVSYAQDGTYGLALHSKSHFNKSTLFDAFVPSPTSGVPPQITDMMFLVQDSALPGETLSIDITMHFSAACDLKSVTSSYVTDFQAFAGPMQYAPGPKDNWPWLFFGAFDAEDVTEANPLGYDGDMRRFDLPSSPTGGPYTIGPLAFAAMVSSVNAVSAGTLFKQPQGYNPRGAEYRADFDVWPTAVQENLPTLIDWYNANGLHFGLLAQPDLIDVTLNYTTDQCVYLNEDEPSQMAMLMARFTNMAALGVSAYYLDSFGLSLSDAIIMRAVREQLGPAVSTFSEFTSDLMLPYSGVYTTLEGTAGTEWYSFDDIAIMHLLYPDALILTVDPNNNLMGVATPSQLFSWGLIPMLQDYQAGSAVDYFTQYVALVQVEGKKT